MLESRFYIVPHTTHAGLAPEPLPSQQAKNAEQCHHARLCIHRSMSQGIIFLEAVTCYAPVISLSFRPYSSACNPWSAFFPSSVKSGFPLAVTASVKNLGFHSSSFSCLCVALSRCRSSISCLSLVASAYCLLLIALVTPAQKR